VKTGFRLSASGFTLGLAIAVVGCGYSFSSGGRLPKGAAALRVGPVDNRTALAEAGGIFEGALRDELIARGQLSEGGEVPVLDVQVTALRSAPSTVSSGGALAFRLDADVRARVRDARGAELLTDQVGIGEDYLAGVDVLGTEANRRAALRRLARSAARELMQRLGAAGRFEK
jgi:outer membrane lipopolysaccharide assembly protein LptE/RlpB